MDMRTDERRNLDRSILSESGTGYWIIDRCDGRVIQVWEVFYHDGTKSWGVFALMPQQVTRSWWQGKGEVV